MLIQREIESHLRALMRYFPVVVLTGFAQAAEKRDADGQQLPEIRGAVQGFVQIFAVGAAGFHKWPQAVRQNNTPQRIVPGL
jgi:hypothetical protein